MTRFIQLSDRQVGLVACALNGHTPDIHLDIAAHTLTLAPAAAQNLALLRAVQEHVESDADQCALVHMRNVILRKTVQE